MLKMIAAAAIAVALSASHTPPAHAADDGPVVTGPLLDALTCEKVWWSMLAVEERLEKLGGSCGGGMSRANCYFLKEQLRLLRDQLIGLYYGSYCYLWSARTISTPFDGVQQ